jgi:hypothetical protein
LTPGGPSAEVEVYVWFESDPADDPAVYLAFRRLVQEMGRGAEAPLGTPRLLRRPELKDRDGQLRATWMEVWPAVPAADLADWLDRLGRCAEASGASALALGGRHVEPFVAPPGTLTD